MNVPAPQGSIVVLGDIHFPFHSRPALKKAVELIRNIKPVAIVQVGDLYDFYSFSRFPRSLNVMTPAEELRRGRDLAIKFWNAVKAAAPEALCYQLRGNHDERPLARIAEKFPEAAEFVRAGVDGLFEFEGVVTVSEPSEELFINGVCFQHGHRKFGEHARYNQMSTVTGHLHKGATAFFQNRKGVYWELNAGWLGDILAPVYSYKSQNKLHGCTLGMGVIEPVGGVLSPRFIPF